jgi:hypothetical protein
MWAPAAIPRPLAVFVRLTGPADIRELPEQVVQGAGR